MGRDIGEIVILRETYLVESMFHALTMLYYFVLCRLFDILIVRVQRVSRLLYWSRIFAQTSRHRINQAWLYFHVILEKTPDDAVDSPSRAPLWYDEIHSKDRINQIWFIFIASNQIFLIKISVLN